MEAMKQGPHHGGSEYILKIAHFIRYLPTNDASHIANLYFKKIVRHYGILKNMVSDRDTLFFSHFLLTLWRKMGTNLKLTIACHPQMDGKTQVINRTLGILLRVLVKKNIKGGMSYFLM